MLFNDLYFFLFLLISLLLLSFGSQKYKKIILLIISYTFYGLWNWKFTLLIAWSSLIDYFSGILIHQSEDPKKRKVILLFSVINNLGILAFFKYYNFFISSLITTLQVFHINTSFSTLSIILPVGISFYTFQTMSYTIDIYRRQLVPTKCFIDFSNFVSFFPQLVAGPIERAGHLLPQLEKFNGISKAGIKSGAILFFMGYIKKVLISDNIGSIVDSTFSHAGSLGSFTVFSGVVLFSFQIYFDFSGYSDIARGLSRFLGVELMMNFNQPYFAVNFSEFWTRWHISLSQWLRDYLYIPLGGNRGGKFKTYRNLLLTMLLGGLWHGASWNAVLWGLLHGIYLIFYQITGINRFKFTSAWSKILNILILNIFVLISWIPFRAADLPTTIVILKKIFFWEGNYIPSELFLLIFITFVFLLIDLPAYLFKDHEYLRKLPPWLFHPVILTGLISIVTSMLLSINSIRPFIYFQF